MIEEKVGYKMKVSRFLIDGDMTYEKKLEIECVESEQVIGIIDNEINSYELINGEMRDFLNNARGNP